ncbi:MAG: Fe-S cluster protein [Nitrosomonadales bacterium]|nr:Fe-S cluster protein [Nitrosomonadales bacterium]
MKDEAHKILESLPGKNCGQCGFKTCAELAALAALHPDVLKRCIYREMPSPAAANYWPITEEITWNDALGREYEFILEQFSEDPGPRETIAPLNPANIEKLAVKKGDILYGRPSLVGCPVTHVGVVVEEPDYLNGAITWCIVGPLAARDQGREIGYYQIIAYDGLVRHSREELRIGRRYYFLPRTCVLLSRHSGVISALAKRGNETRVRLEGIWIS